MPTLNWLTREHDINEARKAPYRLLNHVETFGESDTKNMLIQGDNLDALKALLPYYASKIKCIYIDPPYNTKSAFEHYDDNLEHTQWLSLMYPRLEMLRELLSPEGSIWVSIDDNESHYLKVIMDEVFGRNNFVTNIIWRKNYAPKSSAKHFSEDHDHILVYAKNADQWRPNLLPRTEKQNKAYKNPDNDPRGPWRPNNLAARNFYSLGTYPITCPSGRVVAGPPAGSYWRVSEKKFWELDADNRIWWGKNGNNIPAPKIFLSEVKAGRVPQTFWPYDEVGHTQDAKREIVALFKENVFGTPKPEKLIERVLTIATNENDFVLDSFLGSGTTAAVALKMNRKFLAVEIGEHAKTHCIERLKKVISGEQGGISKTVKWNGGGGFQFLQLGTAVFDYDGRIADNVDFKNLAAHIWFTETQSPLWSEPRTPLLGVHNGIAYYLLYNGIMKDKRPNTGNVLNSRVLQELPKHNGPKVIYGERTLFGPARLEQEKISFKLTPYDINGR